MPLTLHVDTARWRGHLSRYVSSTPASTGSSSQVTVVPVTKGNGYGFGNSVLAAEASRLGASTLAVGTYEELRQVSEAFPGDLLVLSPWRAGHSGAVDDHRVIHTVSGLADLRRLADGGDRPRVVVELLTSMRRHGIDPEDLPEIAPILPTVRFEGFALHLPLAGDHTDEARRLADLAYGAVDQPDRAPLWVSHLTPAAAAALGAHASAEVRLRVATALWLGDRGALRARATVLDAHPVRRGDRYGYRQRRATRAGTILVVSGGTAHGVALEAPTPAATARQRVVALARGGLESVGRALSPFRVAGRQRWFAEPPHMQCSMIWLPGDVAPPAAGAEVDVDVRFTTTAFDTIAWDGA